MQVCKKQRAVYVAALGAFESSAEEEPFSDILKELGFNVSNTTTPDSTSTDVLTTSTSKAKVTHSVKETPMSTTDFVENDEFFERFAKSESVLLSTSHMMHALFFIFIVLFA